MSHALVLSQDQTYKQTSCSVLLALGMNLEGLPGRGSFCLGLKLLRLRRTFLQALGDLCEQCLLHNGVEEVLEYSFR